MTAKKKGKKEKKKTKKSKKDDENIVYVGNKPIMSYVLAIITQFQSNSAKEVEVKARGRVISKAVDVVEFARNKFLKDIEVDDIEIGTEKVQGDRGEVNVSVMTIRLKK